MPMQTQHAAASAASAVVLPCDGRRTLVPDNQRDRAPAGYPHTGANTEADSSVQVGTSPRGYGWLPCT